MRDIEQEALRNTAAKSASIEMLAKDIKPFLPKEYPKPRRYYGLYYTMPIACVSQWHLQVLR
jgi:hypothetical protein